MSYSCNSVVNLGVNTFIIVVGLVYVDQWNITNHSKLKQVKAS